MANPSSRRQRPVLLAVIFSVIFVLLLAASFVLGNLSSWSGTLDVARLVGLPDLQAERSTGTVGQTANSDEPGSLDQFTARLNEVAAILNSDALHVFTQSELDTATKTAIDGLLAVSSDKYAQYFTPSEYADYESSANSQFVGIGIQVQSDSNGVPMVVRVFPNSPAAEQGVESGDLIIAIDGVRQDWTVEDAVSTIKRDPGQSVTIIWQRSGEERTTTMAVRQVTIPTVTTQLLEYQGHQVGYIYLSQFSPNSAAEMRTAINDLTSQGAESFILDLRDNPGGLLDQAVAITSLFVAQGDVVQIVENSGTTVKKVTGQPLTDKSLVVLINGASASAAELTTAALQENGRATVIGEQSYGKGTVQAIQPLSFGGAIKYTIAHYLGPDGTSIDGVGVTPDIYIDDGIDQAALYAEAEKEANSSGSDASSSGSDASSSSGSDASSSSDASTSSGSDASSSTDASANSGTDTSSGTDASSSSDASSTDTSSDASSTDASSADTSGTDASSAAASDSASVVENAYKNMVYPPGHIWPGDPGFVYNQGDDPFLDAALQHLTGTN